MRHPWRMTVFQCEAAPDELRSLFGRSRRDFGASICRIVLRSISF
jgi:hypothetical protein